MAGVAVKRAATDGWRSLVGGHRGVLVGSKMPCGSSQTWAK